MGSQGSWRAVGSREVTLAKAPLPTQPWLPAVPLLPAHAHLPHTQQALCFTPVHLHSWIWLRCLSTYCMPCHCVYTLFLHPAIVAAWLFSPCLTPTPLVRPNCPPQGPTFSVAGKMDLCLTSDQSWHSITLSLVIGPYGHHVTQIEPISSLP